MLCHSYDYSNDAQNLKLFSTALKDAYLWYTMGLGGNIVRTWDDIHNLFLKKWKEHCKYRDLK